MPEESGSIPGVAEGASELAEIGKNAARAAAIEKTRLGDIVVGFIRDVAYYMITAGLTRDVINVNPDVDAMDAFYKKAMSTTALITALVSEDAAEIVSESASEALSNAAYSGFGGAIDSLVRLRVGAMPPQDWPDASDIAHPATAALLDAWYGVHWHVTILRRIANDILGIRDDLLADSFFMDFIETYRYRVAPKARLLTRMHVFIESMFQRALESVAAVLEALFTRIEDAANEYRAAKIMYENGAIDQTQFQEIEAKISSELDAAEDELDAVIEDFISAIQEWNPTQPDGIDALIDMVRQAIDDAENATIQRLQDYYNNMWQIRVNGRSEQATYVVYLASGTHIIRPTSEGM